MSPLSPFHPVVQRWFTETLGTPTEVQAGAWPAIATGGHVLMTAPTGTGKTLAAFLWPLNQLLTGAWPGGRVRVIYVSPLKALNNDIRRNLLAPLAALRRRFDEAGVPHEDVSVLTRSGDTPSQDRQRMLRHPPEILITTPESLNLLVTAPSATRFLAGVTLVILDEIHAVVGSRRGTHLLTAVDRLTRLSGEFQRVALSATVKPLDRVAAWVAGYTLEMQGETPVYEPRPIQVVQGRDPRTLDLQVLAPGAPDERVQPDVEEGVAYWRGVAGELRREIGGARSTLVFGNSRRIVEKVTRFLNEDQPEEIAWAHHGSLARDIRLRVEERLKAGELKAIVATSSLELGIDVGAVDQVILVQSPPTVSAAIQRIGRAGHQVGRASVGRLHPLEGRDLLDAAVLARATVQGDLEPVLPLEAPLDVLAQVIVAMTGTETWDVDALYAFLRSSAPYHGLSRRRFDLVVDMLAGRYAEVRIRELEPRISLDGVDRTVSARPGALRDVYQSGGTIPDRGYYNLRLQETKAKIGELDEEFVWERSLGDTFTLGTQTWRIHRITHNDVEVRPVGPDVPPSIIPFWRSEARNRDWHLAERVALFLEEADGRLDDPAYPDLLCRDHLLEPAAARALVSFLALQKEVTRSPLPHRHHLLVEHHQDPLNRSGSKQVLLHTRWGGRANQPYALALSAALTARTGAHVEVFHDDGAVLLLLPEAFRAEDVLTLVTASNVLPLLREHLPETALFGAFFREAAGRALLLPRPDAKRRLPLWLNRMRSRKLLDAVSRFDDFPIVLEAWRSLLQDEFDLPCLQARLEEVATGEIRVTEAVTTGASPFGDGLLWRMTNVFMYGDDAPQARGGARVRPDLLQEVVRTAGLRPPLPAAVIRAFVDRTCRLAPGYAPTTPRDLVDHVRERRFVPWPAWEALLAACARDGDLPAEELVFASAEKLDLRVGTPADGVLAREDAPRIARALGWADGGGSLDSTPSDEPSAFDGLPAFLADYLRSLGPVPPAALAASLGLDPTLLQDALDDLARTGTVLLDVQVEGIDGPCACDAENLEILLRMLRAARRPTLQPLPLARLPLFLAAWHGLLAPEGATERLQRALEQLLGHVASAEAWEEHLLPVRVRGYQPGWLDALLQETDLAWFGEGEERISFGFPGERRGVAPDADLPPALAALLDRRRTFSFEDLLTETGAPTAEATRLLWRAAWAGRVTSEGFGPLRRGIEQGFAPASVLPAAGTRPGRAAFSRWKASRPFGGAWTVLPPPLPVPTDPLDALDDARDRARTLLDRHGVVFRELCEREAPAFAWSTVFRALRLLELSGEVVAGCFFDGVPGPQFARHEAVRLLSRPLPDDVPWCVNATDPASPCGLGLPGLPGGLPRRVPGHWVVGCGDRVVAVLTPRSKRLDLHVPADDAGLPSALDTLKFLLDRPFRPLSELEIETVNDTSPRQSPYHDVLRDAGWKDDWRTMVRRRKGG